MKNTPPSNFLYRLKHKWGLQNMRQVVLILVVFALTGTTVVGIKPMIFSFFGIEKGEASLVTNVLYLILILPLYQIILLIYGFLFGQFHFFWEKEKQLIKRLFGKKNDQKNREKNN
jgi:hypothetical protein